MTNGNTNCPKCGALISETSKFCSKCGYTLTQFSRISRESLFGGLKKGVKKIGEKTSGMGERAKGVVSQDRATEAAKSLLNMVTKVAREARKELPPDMVRAIDLRANVSFVAFSIGVIVDLEKLQPKEVVIDEKSN